MLKLNAYLKDQNIRFLRKRNNIESFQMVHGMDLQNILSIYFLFIRLE